MRDHSAAMAGRAGAMMRSTPIRCACLLLLFGTLEALPAFQASDLASETKGTRWAILVSGVSGDRELQRELIAMIKDMYSVLTGPLNLSGDHVQVLVDDPSQAPDLNPQRSTAENLRKACRWVAGRSGPEDTVLLFIAGHGSYDGNTYKFNLVGPDPAAGDLAADFDAIRAGRLIVINTTTCSGASAGILARPGRIVVTATRSGNEKNRTHMGRYFVEAWKDSNADTDRNGHVSVLEAFNYASQKTGEYYAGEGLLQTEHPLLNDGSDGLLARTCYLDSGPMRSDGSILSAEDLQLKRESDALEREIEALKLAREGISEAEYERRLEALLLKLAETSARMRRTPPHDPER